MARSSSARRHVGSETPAKEPIVVSGTKTESSLDTLIHERHRLAIDKGQRVRQHQQDRDIPGGGPGRPGRGVGGGTERRGVGAPICLSRSIANRCVWSSRSRISVFLARSASGSGPANRARRAIGASGL